MKPFFIYPEILSIISVLISNETNPKSRWLVFKLIGTIGALDPYLIKKIMNKYFGGVSEDEEDLTLKSMISFSDNKTLP